MSLRDQSDPFAPDQDAEGLSTLSLLIADRIAQAGDDGVTIHELNIEFNTRHAADKIRSLNRHGFVISETFDVVNECDVVLMVHDPRARDGTTPPDTHGMESGTGMAA
jgi:hypothetical protein